VPDPAAAIHGIRLFHRTAVQKATGDRVQGD
jgi:hypothetical protein